MGEEKPKGNEEAIASVVDEAVNPDLVVWETFRVGEREFQIRPLPFKWDRLFREHAMPIIGAELKPVEVLLTAIVGQAAAYTTEVGVIRSLVQSELEADEHLAPAVAAICASQADASVTDKRKAVEKWTANCESILTRYELRAVLDKQVAVQKDVDRLGESLRTRFTTLGRLVGKNLDFGSLLLGSIVPQPKPSAPGGTSASTSSNSSGSSTGKPATK